MNANQKVNLLIIDDNTDDCTIYKEFFSEHPKIHICSVCYDSIDGMQEIEEYRPDVVLTDFIMPNVDGTAVIKYIKDKLGNQVKIIVVSGVSEAKIVNEVLCIGADYYIMKPVKLEFLLERIISINGKTANFEECIDYEYYIGKYINSIGVPVTLSGYDYITQEMELMIKSKRTMQLKEMNSIIAINNNTSPQCVDACIHNAIAKAHKNHNLKYINLFGQIKKCPGNYMFLKMVREFIINTVWKWHGGANKKSLREG